MGETVGADQYRAALRRFPTGVTVVTCRVGGVDHAMTASAFAAVSLDPPLVLVCVSRRARFAEALAGTRWWAVSILAEESEAAARWFATSGRQLIGQLDRVAHTRGVGGAALLQASLATLECETADVIRAGDHDIVVGRVAEAAVTNYDRPLLYWEAGYRRIGPADAALDPGTA